MGMSYCALTLRFHLGTLNSGLPDRSCTPPTQPWATVWRGKQPAFGKSSMMALVVGAAAVEREIAEAPATSVSTPSRGDFADAVQQILIQHLVAALRLEALEDHVERGHVPDQPAVEERSSETDLVAVDRFRRHRLIGGDGIRQRAPAWRPGCASSACW